MSLQERLNLLVRTDIRLLETCDLRLNGLFFPKYILVLFIGCFFQLKQQYKEKNIAKRIEYPEVYLSAYSLITISVL